MQQGSPHHAAGARNSRAPLADSRLLLVVLLLVALAGSVGSAVAQPPPLERARYLVTTVMACGNCHTPKDADGAPLRSRELAGGGIGFDIQPFAGTAPNITPDRETGIGTLSDDEISELRPTAKGPTAGRWAGKPLAVPMAVNFFKAITPTV